MREQWIEYRKKADFSAWAEMLNVSPLFARVLRNRGLESAEDAQAFLYGNLKTLADPLLLRDMDRAVLLIEETVKAGRKIAVCSDYDDDGIFSGQILYEGIRRVGGTVQIYTPDRMSEGYGLNKSILTRARLAGAALMITCDNGISAREEVEYARTLGMKIIVTDHHEVPKIIRADGHTEYLLPKADAVVDPKRADSDYPFRELCGAGVAYRLIEVLYRRFGVPENELENLHEYVGIATVADVVPLIGENRVLVKAGLNALRKTRKLPLLKLMEASRVVPEQISAYKIGFVIGPSFNAIGRLGDAGLAFRFLNEQDPARASELAAKIHGINEERKTYTEEGFSRAEEVLKTAPYRDDRVLLIPVPEARESVIGIIAGRLKEMLNRPVIVFGRGEDGLLRGSGRSIPSYDLIGALSECRGLLQKFGGHHMAAGMTVLPENLEPLREKLNASCRLTDADLTPKVYVDAIVPVEHFGVRETEELALLEPTGQNMDAPLFAEPHFHLSKISVHGERQNVIRLFVRNQSGAKRTMVLFQEAERFFAFLREEYGEGTPEMLLSGMPGGIDAAFTYCPRIDEFNGQKRVDLVVKNYCRIR